jgi:hypothetical protein
MAQVIGPPPGMGDTIGSIEMLRGIEDDQPIFYGYVHITAEDAQALADAGGGVMEIGSVTSVLAPWSAMLYQHFEIPFGMDAEEE